MSEEERAGRSLTEVVGLSLKKIEDQLISVAEMQRDIMPDPERLEVFSDFDIFGKTLPIAVVGGDFYDFIDLEGRFDLKGKMGIVIADAAGHGLAAAMLIRDLNTALLTGIALQAHYEKDTTPFLFTKLNRRLYRSSQDNQFITCFYGELHQDGKLRYINCGHYSPYLVKPEQVLTLDIGGSVLGAFWDLPLPYEVGEIRMEKGDVLVCFTDGIVEAFDAEGNEYGRQRLLDAVLAARDKDARRIFDAVVADVDRFAAGARQQDDRTITIIKRGLSG
ncbi:MAG TPA: PP2C family protein-serine/threonine phosphatase, partial [Acidobacteriota bacterium]|nr:PP2C family protein-serine/threonine phosphatase [Acidobacteriota bacterium]